MNAEYYKLLKEFIAFKTVSSNENLKQECKNCCNRIEWLLTQNWFKVKNIIQYWNPILIANYMTSPDAETALIYGNYDTSSAEKKDWWKEDPFELYLWKDKIIWRWIAEGKWILLLQMMSIFRLIKENKLKYNITFLIEWERFIWSTWLKNLLQESLFLQEAWLSANFVLSSIWTLTNDSPTITTSFRWGFDTKIELKTANKKIDTERFWWIVTNPAIEWWKLISKLYDSSNQITIPYFYYEVEWISANEKTMNWRIPFDKDSLIERLELKSIKLDNDLDFYSKSGLKPCIEITWFDCWDFWQTIPDKATITINTKLVNNQKTASIQTLFENRIKWTISNNIDHSITFYGHSEPTKIDIQNTYSQQAISILEKIYNKKAIQVSSWFTFPIAKFAQEKVSKNIINIPLINDDCNIHSTMENFDIELLEKWSEFLYEFFRK